MQGGRITLTSRSRFTVPTLFVHGEQFSRTIHEKIFVACNGLHDAAWFQDFDQSVEDLIAAVRAGERAEIRWLLQLLVPEYRPAEPAPPTASSVKPAVEKAPIPINLTPLSAPVQT